MARGLWILLMLAAVLAPAVPAPCSETVSPVVVVPPDYNDLKNAVQNLQTRMGTAETNITNLQSSVSGLSTNVSNLTSRMSTAESSISSLTSRMGTAESNINTIFNQLGLLNTQVSQAVSKADSAYSQALSAVNTANTAYSTAQSASSTANSAWNRVLLVEDTASHVRVSTIAGGWALLSVSRNDNWAVCTEYYGGGSVGYSLPLMITIDGVRWYLVSPTPQYRRINQPYASGRFSITVQWPDVERGQSLIPRSDGIGQSTGQYGGCSPVDYVSACFEYIGCFWADLWSLESPRRTGVRVRLVPVSRSQSDVPLWLYRTASGQTHYFLP